MVSGMVSRMADLFVDGPRQRLGLVLTYLKAGLTMFLSDSFHIYNLLFRYFHWLATLFEVSTLLHTFVCSTVFWIITWSTRVGLLLVVLLIIFGVLWVLLAMLVLWPISSSLVIWLFILSTLIGRRYWILNVFYQIS